MIRKKASDRCVKIPWLLGEESPAESQAQGTGEGSH